MRHILVVALCELPLIYHKVFLCFFRLIGEVFSSPQPLHIEPSDCLEILPGSRGSDRVPLSLLRSSYSPLSKMAYFQMILITPQVRTDNIIPAMKASSNPFIFPSPSVVRFLLSPSLDCQKPYKTSDFKRFTVAFSDFTSTLHVHSIDFFAF